MMKRIVSLLLIAMLLVGLLTACGNDGPLTPDEATEIVLEDMDVDLEDVTSVDIHPTALNGSDCYIVYITVNGEHMQYVIDCFSGEILLKEETETGHHH